MPKKKIKSLIVHEIKPTDTILGVDYSLSKFGWCLIRADGEILGSGRYDNPLMKLPNTYNNSARKMDAAAAKLQWVVKETKPTFCIFEGSAMAAQGAARMILSENLGVGKAALAWHDLIMDELPPQTVKKYATDDGHADKELMKFFFQTLTELEIRDEDIIDAYWIAQTYLGTRTRIKDSTESS